MSNLTVVTRIGAGVRLTETAAPQVIESVPAEYDWTARGAVTQAIHAWAVPAGTEVPPVKIGAKGNQRATDYGRGVDALAKAVKRLLGGDEKPVTLRATLSGEGGGSVTIPADHPLYAALVEMITDGQES